MKMRRFLFLLIKLNGDVIKLLIINILILFSLHDFAQTPVNQNNIPGKTETSSLSSVLEKMRTRGGLNFIYSGNAVKNIRVDSKYSDKLTGEELKNILKRNGLACRYFEEKNIVIYEDIEPPKKNYARVEIKNIINKDPGYIKEPQIISCTVPIYPKMAVLNKIEGKVKIKLFVTKDGNVSRTEIESSSGSSLLDGAAIEYAGKLKFIPAQVNGKFQNIWLSMLFDYYLKDN